MSVLATHVEAICWLNHSQPASHLLPTFLTSNFAFDKEFLKLGKIWGRAKFCWQGADVGGDAYMGWALLL